MKPIKSNASFLRMVLFTIAAGSCLCHSAQGQQYGYNRSRKMYVGVEVGTGTRSLKMQSDIEALKNLRVNEEGINVGLVAGTEIFQAKVRKGFYRASATAEQQIKLAEFEASVNAMFLSILQVKNRYFKPYVTVGLARNSLTFSGGYALPGVAAAAPQQCCCETSGGGPLADPDSPGNSQMATAEADPDIPAIEEETSPKDSELAKVFETRVNTGIGVQLFAPAKKYFLSMFIEVKYGLLVGTIATSEPFRNTKASNSLFANLGIAFGLNGR